MKIFLDFDRVIFDSDKFIVDLNKVYFKNKISENKLREYKKTISNVPGIKNKKAYNLQRAIKFVAKGDAEKQKEISNDMNVFLKKINKYVFPDTPFFLRTISKNDLLLLSYGDTDFQQRKICGSGIEKYFSEIFINTDDKIKFIEKAVKNKRIFKEKIFFVDDKLENFTESKKPEIKIVNIWLNRKNKKETEGNLKRVNFEAKNLKEVLKIIKKHNK